MSAISKLRFHLLTAGCELAFRSSAWRCPSCRTAESLRMRPEVDGSIGLRCARGCERGEILRALGLLFVDIGPVAFRRERQA